MIITRRLDDNTYISGEFDLASYIGHVLSIPFGIVLGVFLTAWILGIPFQYVIDTANDIFSILLEIWETL